jgi:hypothetical protein
VVPAILSRERPMFFMARQTAPTFPGSETRHRIMIISGSVIDSSYLKIRGLITARRVKPEKQGLRPSKTSISGKTALNFRQKTPHFPKNSGFPVNLY